MAARSRSASPKKLKTSNMRYHKLGGSDMHVSEICLGTMTFGNQNTEKEAHQQLDYAVSRGINFIDTAESYPVPPSKEIQGRTEEYVGTWLENVPDRAKIYVATKVAGYSIDRGFVAANRTYPRGPEAPCRLDKASIRAACEGSLRRLRTDYIDLYQIHWPDRYVPGFGTSAYDQSKEREAVPFEEQVAAMGELISEGKIRHWGVSNETSYGLCKLYEACVQLGVPPPVSIQNSYSLLHRSFESELAETCSPGNLNISLLPWSPLAGGALTGKYLASVPKHDNPAYRFHKFQGFMGRFNLPRVQKVVAEYDKVAKSHNLTLTQLSLAFMKTKPFVASTIIGATTMEQLKEDIDAFDIILDDATSADVKKVYLEHRDPILED